MRKQCSRATVSLNGHKVGTIRRLGFERWVFVADIPGNPQRYRQWGEQTYPTIEAAVRGLLPGASIDFPQKEVS